MVSLHSFTSFNYDYTVQRIQLSQTQELSFGGYVSIPSANIMVDVSFSEGIYVHGLEEIYTEDGMNVSSLSAINCRSCWSWKPIHCASSGRKFNATLDN